MRKFSLLALVSADTAAYRHVGLLLRDLLTKTDFSDKEVDQIISLEPGAEMTLGSGHLTVRRDPDPVPVQQEFDEFGRHRLVNTQTGHRTPWTSYVRFCYLDGMVGCTAYFLQKEAVLTPDEFCSQVGTTINRDPREETTVPTNEPQDLGPYASDEFVGQQSVLSDTPENISPEGYARDGFYNTPLTPENLQRMVAQAEETLRLVKAWREFVKR